MTPPNERRAVGRDIKRNVQRSLALGLGGSAGIALGATVGPLGVFLGILLGLVAGFLAGKVMARDENLHADRTRHLDAVIGITEGSLGAGPVSLVPEPELSEPLIDGDSWLAEWLTPPPPLAE